MTKADVMSGFKTVKICTSYMVDGKECQEIPFNNDVEIEPVYTELRGWEEDISGLKDFNMLPGTLKRYIEFIENQTRVPVTMISVGPDRNQTIIRNDHRLI